MSEELQIRDNNLTELGEELKNLLLGLEKSKRRQLDLDEIESKLNQYENSLDAFQLELKQLNPTERKNWKKKALGYKRNFKEMKNDYEWKRNNDTKNQLLGDHQEAKPTDIHTSEGIMNVGRGQLQESKDSLARSLQVTDETLKIGKDTAAMLDAQYKQLQKIFDELKSIDSTLARSTRILKRIGRKIATDKYLWVVIFLVLFAIIFIIAWKATGHSANVNTPPALPNA